MQSWQNATGIYQGVGHDEGKVVVVVLKDNEEFKWTCPLRDLPTTVADLQAKVEGKLAEMTVLVADLDNILTKANQHTFTFLMLDGRVSIQLKSVTRYKISWQWHKASTGQTATSSRGLTGIQLLEYLCPGGLNALAEEMIQNDTIGEIETMDSPPQPIPPPVVTFFNQLPKYNDEADRFAEQACHVLARS